MPLAMWQGLQLCGGANVCFYGVPNIGIVPLGSNSFYKRHMLTSVNTVLYVSWVRWGMCTAERGHT